jgi:tetratricopeptide (TPR) repeat protein
MQIGGDPELTAPGQQGPSGGQPLARNANASLTSLLNVPVWLSIPDLFTTRHDISSYTEGNHHTMFYAESWVVMHYLISNNKLPETGTYFGLVESQGMPVEQAIQQAYGMDAAQFEQAVKDYFKAIAPVLVGDKDAPPSGVPAPIRKLPPAVTPSEMGASVKQVPGPEAQALVAEMQARLPEHREAAVQELQSISNDPKAENAVAHRALGWVDLHKRDLKDATDEFQVAIRMDPQDAWSRYYISWMRYQAAQSGGHYFQGLANLMQDMRLVTDWDPDFAEAYNMLAMARVEGGGVNSATEAIRLAVSLAPRNQRYQLNMARIDMAAKNWQAAGSVLERLQASKDVQIAQAATKDLEAMPTLKKYGIMPYEQGQSQPTAVASDEKDASEKKENEALHSTTPDAVTVT